MPVVAVPVALALLVALVRLAMGAEIDRSAGFIAVLAAVAVGLRHILPPAPTDKPPTGSAGQSPVPSFVATPAAENRGGLAAAITTMREVPRAPGAVLLVGAGVGAPAGFRGGVLADAARRVRDVVGDTQPGSSAVAWIDTDIAVLTSANVLQAYALAHRIVRALRDLEVPVCVGLTDIAAESTDEVLRRAVLALRRAWQLGPGRVEWYDASVEEDVHRVQAIEAALPDALRRGELDLMYQPIIDLARNRPAGVEALFGGATRLSARSAPMR